MLHAFENIGKVNDGTRVKAWAMIAYMLNNATLPKKKKKRKERRGKFCNVKKKRLYI